MLGAKFILGEDFAPWHRLKIWNLFEKRDYAKAWDEMKRWEMPFHELTMEVMSHGGHWIALSKALAEFSGVAGGHGGPPRPPQRPLTAHEKEKLKRLIDESGILLEKKSV
jgi:dihydrodipicolinate synthase/N-acetylneuraminate lyase